MNNNEQGFKVGDIVEAFGCRGVIKLGNNKKYPVVVGYDSGIEEWFTADGRLNDWHKEPSLKLIERPKKKVKKFLKGWVNVYRDSTVTYFFKTKKEADSLASCLRIACIEINQEYEVEE